MTGGETMGSRWKGQGLIVGVGLGVAFALVALSGIGVSRGGSVAFSGETAAFLTDPAAARPGGASTHSGPFGRDAFLRTTPGLTDDQRMNVTLGNALFARPWVSAPSSTKAADGLGPLYNARSCRQCHLRNGRGHPPEADASNAVSMLLRLSLPAETDAERSAMAEGRLKVVPHPILGTQLQEFAIQGLKAEGKPVVTYEPVEVTLAGGETITLRKPSFTIANPGYGAIDPAMLTSARIAPPMIGLGLLDAIPAEALEARADPEDRDGDGISGRTQRIPDPATGESGLGRFGWKAGEPTVNAQSQAAFNGDIGMSTPLYSFPAGDCMAAQEDCRAAPTGGDPQYEGLEIPSQMAALIVEYASHIAVPARRNGEDPQVRAGGVLFAEAGCPACHVPRQVTATDYPDPTLAGQTIWPFTDLLLHDMGPDLADGRPEGRASGSEWRTPPLWGVGLTQEVSGQISLLHDGRARSVPEAILWHGGEGEAAREAFRGMDAADRAALVAFVESL
ncbi:di-heme oxidoredictase family protein [Rhodospirillum sp. A1_3_36]|uniref:di-heme oxidoreductase family protein n=1 Tax=Rhodospirillum sp. A1_3_36 TaxID=3391666 RepID=UPI0039A5A5FA